MFGSLGERYKHMISQHRPEDGSERYRSVRSVVSVGSGRRGSSRVAWAPSGLWIEPNQPQNTPPKVFVTNAIHFTARARETFPRRRLIAGPRTSFTQGRGTVPGEYAISRFSFLALYSSDSFRANWEFLVPIFFFRIQLLLIIIVQREKKLIESKLTAQNSPSFSSTQQQSQSRINPAEQSRAAHMHGKSQCSSTRRLAAPGRFTPGARPCLVC